MAQRTCSKGGCDGKHLARGLCSRHYQQAVDRGEIVPQPRRQGRQCSIPDCTEPHTARGWCAKHYQRWKHNGDPLIGERVRNQCTVDGCDERVKSNGYCSKHYGRWKRTGDPTRCLRGDGKARLLAKVDKYCPVPQCCPDRGPCWLWTGSINDWGYGKIKVDGKDWSTHRYSYTVHVDQVPDDLDLDHLCRRRHCCNPQHLEPVTCRENLMRGTGFAAINAAKTHCPENHEYDLLNTYWDSRGSRGCKTCRRGQRKNSSGRTAA